MTGYDAWKLRAPEEPDWEPLLCEHGFAEDECEHGCEVMSAEEREEARLDDLADRLREPREA